MSSRTGKASAFGGAKMRVSKMLRSPWGKPVPKADNGVHGSRPAGSSRRSGRTHESTKAIDYPVNDPARWPLENPHTRADLRKDSAMTQHKADWMNKVTNDAYKRGGYAG